jgi:hypothetical protein
MVSYFGHVFLSMLMDQYVDTQVFNVPMILISICRSELNCQSYMLRNRADVSSRVKCVPRLDGILHDFSPSAISGRTLRGDFGITIGQEFAKNIVKNCTSKTARAATVECLNDTTDQISRANSRT